MKAEHPFWQNSYCKNSYLHRFSIKEEYPEGVKEVCEICGMSKFFRIIEGKLSNAEYMSYHLKQALPNFHPMYERQHTYNPLEDKILSPYA